jgi:hypothetical protein
MVLMAIGLLLAMAKLIYSFFDFYNILDIVVFLIAGFIIGGKIPSNQWPLGLLLTLPTIALCLFFVINLGYSSIVKGVGTAYAVSLIVIPLAAGIGLFIRSKRTIRKSVEHNK